MEDRYRAIYSAEGIADVTMPTSYPTSCLLGCVEVVGCMSQVSADAHKTLVPIMLCIVTHTYIHIARVRINRGRLPILLVVSSTGKMNISLSAFAPENLVSRDGFGSPVPRQPAHLRTQAESGRIIQKIVNYIT